MTHFGAFSADISKLDPVLHKRSHEEWKTLKATRTALAKAYMDTEQYKLLESMVSSKITLSWDAFNNIVLQYDLKIDHTTTNDHQRLRNLYVGEKTTNLLLNGKLLTDEEKRKLVHRLTGGLVAAPDSTDKEASATRQKDSFESDPSEFKQDRR